LDTSVFLGGVNEEIRDGIKRHVVFNYIWDRAKEGKFRILTFAITIAEVFKKKKPIHATPETPMLDEFLNMMEEDFVDIIEVDREIGFEAHRLCRLYAPQKLMPNDGIHLACALRAKCDVLLAWDRPLVSVPHPNIKIDNPKILNRTLFSEAELATPLEIAAYEAAERLREQSLGKFRK